MTIPPDELCSIYLFAGLDEEQLEAVARTTRLVHLDEGQPLFDFSQPARHYFYNRSGQIKLFRNSPDGGEKIIWIVRAGETFAEAVMFMRGHRYPVSAEAITPSDVLAFDQKTFMGILKGSVETCFRLMATMSTRLHQQVNEIDNLTLHNATFRLVSHLLQHLREGPGQESELHLSAPKNVIASRLSIQPETFSRILARLSKKELLKVEGQNIVLRDVEGLRKLVHL